VDFMFVVFASITVLGALVMAFHENIVHSAFALVATLFGVAGLYWTMGADFLGGLQVLLYVGGVTVLLLFAVMLTTRDAMRRSMGRYLLMAPIVGLAGVYLMKVYQSLDDSLALVETVEPGSSIEALGNALVTRDGHLLTFEVVAVLLLLVLIGAVTVARRGQGSTT
jgi:NADH:ubiquinone oxidoreductase subunit 6 (subunit J)